MAKPYKQLSDDLQRRLDARPDGTEIRARIRAKLDGEIAAHNHTLAELRRARKLTQTQLGAALGVTQARVSELERGTDLYLSTLSSYVQAMGGDIKIVGVFDDQEVELEIGELAEHEPA